MFYWKLLKKLCVQCSSIHVFMCFQYFFCPKVKKLNPYLQVSHRKVKNRPLGGRVEPLIRVPTLETFHTSFLYQVELFSFLLANYRATPR